MRGEDHHGNSGHHEGLDGMGPVSSVPLVPLEEGRRKNSRRVCRGELTPPGNREPRAPTAPLSHSLVPDGAPSAGGRPIWPNRPPAGTKNPLTENINPANNAGLAHLWLNRAVLGVNSFARRTAPSERSARQTGLSAPPTDTQYAGLR